MYPIIVLLGKKIRGSELAGQFTLVKGTPMTSMLIDFIKNLRLTNGKCAVSVVCHLNEVCFGSVCHNEYILMYF
jgi:hypothetical protein